MIYEEHGLTTEIAFNSALKKAGIEITSYIAPFEITTDAVCIVDTTKHDAEIRADERRKMLAPYDVESIEELIQNVKKKTINEITSLIHKKINNLEDRESSACNEGRWLDGEKCIFAIEILENLAEQMKGSDENET